MTFQEPFQYIEQEYIKIKTLKDSRETHVKNSLVALKNLQQILQSNPVPALESLIKPFLND